MTSIRTADRALLGPRTRAEAAANEIRRRILSGEFSAGQPLRQDALADELGVSRIPLREAFVQLEAEGLLKIFPHRGAVVTPISVEDIVELVDLRILLEPRLLGRSAPHLTPADYDTIDAILAEYSAQLRDNRIARWGELNTELHGLLYRHANLPRTEQIVATLLASNDRYARIQIAQTNGRERAEREHAEIVRLCRRGSYKQACKTLTDHIHTAGQALVALIGRQPRLDDRNGNLRDPSHRTTTR